MSSFGWVSRDIIEDFQITSSPKTLEHNFATYGFDEMKWVQTL